MDKNRSFDEVWDELKASGIEEKKFFETAEETARIINELAEERIRRGLTQRQLAQMCGLKQSAIARMESLQSIPRLDTLLRVAKSMNMNLELRAESRIQSVFIDATNLALCGYKETRGYRYLAPVASGVICYS